MLHPSQRRAGPASPLPPPQVNNCVGQFNQKHFLLFIFYVNALSVYALVLIVIRFSTCFTSSGCTLSGMGACKGSHVCPLLCWRRCGARRD